MKCIKKNRIEAFTILEIMIIIVVTAIIIGLGSVQYMKAIEQAHLQDAIHQLRLIHRAENLYFSRTGQLWMTSGETTDLDDINERLELTIEENGMTYSCVEATRVCTAVRQAPGQPFVVSLTTTSALDNSNPACVVAGGNCP